MLMLLLLVCTVANQSVADTRLRVAVYQNSPKLSLDAKGQPQGLFIDILAAIAADEGWQLDYVSGTWQQSMERLERGEVDLLPDVAWTAERARRFQFHREPVMSSWSQVYARLGTEIRSLPDLAGKRVAVLDGSIQESEFRSMVTGFDLDLALVPFASYEDAFAAVALTNADAVVTNRFYGTRHAQQAGLEDTAIIFSPAKLFFAGSPTVPDTVLQAIDRQLVTLKQDASSVYYRSLQRWVAGDPRIVLPQWLLPVISGLIGLLALGVVWVLLLRKQVRARTHLLNQRNQEITVINKTLRAIGAQLNTRQVLQDALQGCLTLTHFQRGLVWVIDDGVAPASDGSQTGSVLTLERHDGAFYAGQEYQAVALPAWEDDFFANDSYRLVAAHQQPRLPITTLLNAGNASWYVYLPLEAQDRVIGIMCLASHNPLHPSSHALGMAQEIGVPLALALANTRLYEKERKYAHDLELRVAERTSELVVANHQLLDAKFAAEKADRIKSAFLATMSHELRTPLNSIIGFTGILLQQLAGPLNPEQNKQLGMVRDSARHLLALINDVLDISKIEAGELELANEPFSVSEAVNRVVNLMRPLAERKGLALVLDSDDSLPVQRGDQRRFEQVLINLVNNAVKFTESGGVTLSVHVDGNQLVIAVADTGIGIKPEDMNELFEAFRQVDSEISRKHDGTGLGLTICRSLIEMMSGTMDVASEWGKGSVFSVYLPLQQQKGESA